MDRYIKRRSMFMLGSAKRWWTTGSTAFRLILAMLGLSLLSALSLLFLKGRKQASVSRQDTLRRESLEAIDEAEGAGAVHHEQAERAIAQAESAEAQASSIDTRLQASRDRIAALKKELGR